MKINEELFDGSLDVDPQLERDQAFSHLVALPACKGVVLFADSENRPVQLLIAANIRRTARARLYTEEIDTPSKRPEIASIVRRIFYVCSYNDFKATLSHYSIAKIIWPGNYADLITFPKLNLVKINPLAKWPGFSVVSSVHVSSDEIIFGPFQSRRSATEFVNALENAFSLCHRPDLAANPEKAASCPYLQMEKCPAPCAGKISEDQYRKQIENAISAASGSVDQIRSDLQKIMDRYCAELEFEQANHVKYQLQQLDLIAGYQYKWTGRLSNLAVLHVDLSAKVKTKGKRKNAQTLATFLITKNGIDELASFDLEGTENFHGFLSKQLEFTSLPAARGDRKTSSEHLALLCSFLYRSKPAGIWINCSSNSQKPLPDANKLEWMIKNRFEIES
ncbi:MAG: hypothetical protein K9M75_08530 [Phycisphaerae bacterium]|nr:hypothetical protein [Phycisphaerae bacterium]